MANPSLATAFTASLIEDTSVALAIEAAPAATDGSEYLTLEISGIPSGWTASGLGIFNAAAGTWSLTLGAGMGFSGGPTLTPPADCDIDIDLLIVSARSYSSSTGALIGTRARSVNVIVDAAADTPNLTAANVTGLEDTSIAVDITSALKDTDGSESFTSITILDVPTGFTVNNATPLGGGTWQVTSASFAYVSISGPADYYGTINLRTKAVAGETALSGDETTTANNMASIEKTFSVTFLDVNDPATVSLVNTLTSLSEGASTSTTTKVADIVITDDTLGTNALSLVGADAGYFEIKGNELHLKAGVSLDYEANQVLDVTVAVDDPTVGAAPDSTVAFSLHLIDVNEAPVITSNGGASGAAINLAENSLLAATVHAADPENRAITYQIVAASAGGAADSALFAINSATGALTFNSGPNFENPTDAGLNGIYDVTVRALDALGGLADEQVLSFVITDVNEAPTLALTNKLVSVNEYDSETVRFKAADITVSNDGLGSAVLSLSGADASLFEIDGNALYLKSGSFIEQKKNAILDVKVTVTDPALGAGTAHSQNLAITVVAVDSYVAAIGAASANTMTGTTSADMLDGRDGNDILRGLAGNDLLKGGFGSDLLAGGLGRDILTGGASRDVFVFNAINETGLTTLTRDKITDFQHLVDDIDLRIIDANGAGAGNTAFSFLEARDAAFTGAQGQLRWYRIDSAINANDKTIIEGDINGDRLADFRIELTGLKTLTSADFLL